MKRPTKPKAKTLSLSSSVGAPDDLWLQEGNKRKLRPIVDSVFGQVGWPTCVSAVLKRHDYVKNDIIVRDVV